MDTFNKEDSFFQQTFDHITLTNETLQNKEFEECTFKKCSFIETTFNECIFLNCIFQECTLSAVKPFNSSFLEVIFKDSKVIGFDWTKAKNIRFLEFYSSQLNYSNFSLLKLHNIIIKNCEAHEVDFTETDLTEGNFEGTDFEKSRFSQTNLYKANLRKAFNYAIDFHFNKITHAKFSLPEAQSLLNSLEIELE